MSSSSKTANGAVIVATETTRRRLEIEDGDGNKTWSAPKIHFAFNRKNLCNINNILAERRKLKSKYKPVPQLKPLPTIKKLPTVPITERFNKTIYTISNSVYKPTLPFPNPVTEEPSRKRRKRKRSEKSKFVDDSAIESDGEGGDVPSVPSSPDRSSLTIVTFVVFSSQVTFN